MLKNYLKFSVLFIYFQSFLINAQIKVTSGGKVGLRTSYPNTSYDVHIKGVNVCLDQAWPTIISDNFANSSAIRPGVDGYGYIGTEAYRFFQVSTLYVHCLQTNYYSDFRIKTNIKPLNSSLSNLMLLKGVNYDIKPDFLSKKNDSILIDNSLYKDKMGFIAQDLMKVFPNLVSYNKDVDLYSVNYIGLIPVLVEAIKEQQNTIDILKQKITNNIESQSNTTSNTQNLTGKLEQNHPNPFSQSTTIQYFIPENSINASINIYNLNGSQLETYTINKKGADSISINAGGLTPGIYIYNLIIDGKEIDEKKMVITK